MSPEDFDHLSQILTLFQFNRIVGVMIGFAVIITLVGVIRRSSASLQLRWPMRRAFVLQVSTMLIFLLYIGGGFLLVYSVLRPPREILIAIAGSAAVAIGFSLKDLVASVVAGIILLFDRPFQVGDRVAFSSFYGEIQSIGLRAVKLTTLDDSLVTIPNSRFLTDVVSSSNAGALDMMVEINFHLALDANLGKAKELIYDAVVTSRYVYLKKPVVVIGSEVAIAERLAIQLKAKAYVLDCRYEKAFETDVVLRVAGLFKEHQIGRPTKNA